jgi:hypothetical protein
MGRNTILTLAFYNRTKTKPNLFSTVDFSFYRLVITDLAAEGNLNSTKQKKIKKGEKK